MPAELKTVEEFMSVVERASECRVKLGFRRIRSEEGTKRIRVLKVKARTPSRLYTIVFENIDDGINFAKSLKDECKNVKILDAELEGKI